MTDSENIKIIHLNAMDIACVQAYSARPEGEAMEKIFKWAEAHNRLNDSPLPRLFGFNNPDPTPGNPNYGSEVWLTVPHGTMSESESGVSIKNFSGGLYAVIHCEGDLSSAQNFIPEAWQSLAAWIETSPYTLADHQLLEEQINYQSWGGTFLSLDLYAPISRKNNV